MLVDSFITLFRLPVCWFVLQSTAFCSAARRAQSPREKPDCDAEKLGLSLSVCLNDVDARPAASRAHLARALLAEKPSHVNSPQVCLLKFVYTGSNLEQIAERCGKHYDVQYICARRVGIRQFELSEHQVGALRILFAC